MITVSLEMAKRMKSSGWEKETSLVHETDFTGKSELKMVSPHTASMWSIFINAPTAQEILDELPRNIDEYHFNISNFWKDIAVQYQYCGKYLCRSKSDSLAEVLWGIRIQCKEQGYLPSKQTEETQP